MRIISKFKDFYDSGIAFGVDERIRFNRETDVLCYSHIDKKYYSEHDEGVKYDWPGLPIDRDADIVRFNFANLNNAKPAFKYIGEANKLYASNLTRSFLFFCGMVYPFYAIEFEKSLLFKNTEWSDDYIRYYLWNKTQADEVLPHPGKDKLVSEKRWNSKRKYYVRYRETPGYENENEFTPFNDPNNVNEIFKAPIVVFYRSLSMARNLIINPCLKDLNFSSIMDPFQAFQQISMFMSGPLSEYQDKDLTPEASDIDKVKSHGLDEKYGFRKRKKEI